MQCTRVHLNNALGWLAGVRAGGFQPVIQWGTMRALHSPFDLLDLAEFLPTCAPLMNAWFQIFFFLTEYYSRSELHVRHMHGLLSDLWVGSRIGYPRDAATGPIL